MDLEISQHYFSYIFHPTLPKLYEGIATIGEYQLLLFSAVGKSFKKMWHFEILTWESMGKS